MGDQVTLSFTSVRAADGRNWTREAWSEAALTFVNNRADDIAHDIHRASLALRTARDLPADTPNREEILNALTDAAYYARRVLFAKRKELADSNRLTQADADKAHLYFSNLIMATDPWDY
jgi:hypothetical protein